MIISECMIVLSIQKKGENKCNTSIYSTAHGLHPAKVLQPRKHKNVFCKKPLYFYNTNERFQRMPIRVCVLKIYVFLPKRFLCFRGCKTFAGCKPCAVE